MSLLKPSQAGILGVGIMRNSVFDFAVEVDRQISTLTREQFYLRTGRAKWLLEELYPLSRFALRLKYPGNDPEVEAFEDDGPLDGVVHWGGVSGSRPSITNLISGPPNLFWVEKINVQAPVSLGLDFDSAHSNHSFLRIV